MTSTVVVAARITSTNIMNMSIIITMTSTAAVVVKIINMNIMNTSIITMTSTAAVVVKIINMNIMNTSTFTTMTSTVVVVAEIMSTTVTPTMLSPQSVSTFWRTSAALTVLPKWRNGFRLLKASKALPLLLQQNSFA